MIIYRRVAKSRHGFGLDGERTQAFSVMVLLNQGTKKPIVCNLSIRWYLEVSGVMNPMYNEGFNAAEIVEVDVVV